MGTKELKGTDTQSAGETSDNTAESHAPHPKYLKLILWTTVSLALMLGLVYKMAYPLQRQVSAFPSFVSPQEETETKALPNTLFPSPDIPSPTPLITATATLNPPPPTPTATPIPPTPTPTITLSPTLLPPVRPTLATLDAPPVAHPSSTLSIPTPVPVQGLSDKAITILLLGSDQRPDWEDWHTDAVQYVVVYPDIPSVALLSIPRDLYVYVPGFWMSRINFADMYGETKHYEGGGLGLFNQTLLYNLGISADYYVKVNFDGLIGLVDTLGGVDVPVHCRLEDYWPYPDENGQYHRIALEPGIHHMDGELALWYSRSRLTTSVFSREQRQQQVLEAMWRKAKEIGMLEAAPSLYKETASLYKTDLGLKNMLYLATIAAQLDPIDVSFYNIGQQETIPHTTPFGGSVYLPVWEEIAPLLSDVLAPPASSRAAHNATHVEVWNGTEHSDWDRLAADRLLHYGYVPTLGAPGRHDYTHTQILYFGSTTKGSGLSRLQTLFDVREDNVIYQEDPNAKINLLLILGEDYKTCP